VYESPPRFRCNRVRTSNRLSESRRWDYACLPIFLDFEGIADTMSSRMNHVKSGLFLMFALPLLLCAATIPPGVTATLTGQTDSVNWTAY
jgi:hypothetical protein